MICGMTATPCRYGCALSTGRHAIFAPAWRFGDRLDLDGTHGLDHFAVMNGLHTIFGICREIIR